MSKTRANAKSKTSEAPIFRSPPREGGDLFGSGGLSRTPTITIPPFSIEDAFRRMEKRQDQQDRVIAEVFRRLEEMSQQRNSDRVGIQPHHSQDVQATADAHGDAGVEADDEADDDADSDADTVADAQSGAEADALDAVSAFADDDQSVVSTATTAIRPTAAFATAIFDFAHPIDANTMCSQRFIDVTVVQMVSCDFYGRHPTSFGHNAVSRRLVFDPGGQQLTLSAPTLAGGAFLHRKVD